jgi:hypothetical protein
VLSTWRKVLTAVTPSLLTINKVMYRGHIEWSNFQSYRKRRTGQHRYFCIGNVDSFQLAGLESLIVLLLKNQAVWELNAASTANCLPADHNLTPHKTGISPKHFLLQKNSIFSVRHFVVLSNWFCLKWSAWYVEEKCTTRLISNSTVLFPCGVRHVASRLFSKLVGLYQKVIYVGGSLKGPRSTTAG